MRGFCYDINSAGFNNSVNVPWIRLGVGRLQGKIGPDVIEDVRDEVGP